MKNNSFVTDYSFTVTESNDKDDLYIRLSLDDVYFNSDLSTIKAKTILVFILSDFIKKLKRDSIRIRIFK